MVPILIAGAGIAGLSLALALARHGLSSRILERRERLSEAGAGIQLGPNAVKVLRRLGVAEQLEQSVGRPEAINVFDAVGGRQLARLPLGGWIAERHRAPYWVVHRAALHAALLARVAATPEIALIKGFDVVDAAPVTGGGATRVEVRSARGKTLPGAALIGADGLWSGMRGLLHPRHALNFTGKMAMRTVIPLPHDLAGADRGGADRGGADRGGADRGGADRGGADRGGAGAAALGAAAACSTGVWLADDAHVVHYPINRHRELAIIVVVAAAHAHAGWGTAVADHQVMARLARFAAPLRHGLSQATEWRAWSLYDSAPLPSWSTGAIALLGDAAQPVLPFLAQGGAMAIEGAETLAAAIHRYPDDPARAFAAYEAARRRRVLRVKAAARRNGQTYHMTGVSRLARDSVLRALPGRTIMAGYDWLYGWDGDRLAGPSPD